MNKKTTLLFFLTSAIVGSLLACLYFFWSQPSTGTGADVVKPLGVDTPPTPTTPVIKDSTSRQIPSVTIPETPEQLMVKYDLIRVHDAPLNLMQAMAKLTESADLQMLALMGEKNILPKKSLEALKVFLEKGQYKLDAQNPFSEVGEIERNKKIRWALNLASGGRILVDMIQDDNGQWNIEQINVPAENSSDPAQNNHPFSVDKNDALSLIDGFIQATLAQRFDVARHFVDKSKVADATIAGICILFEEGHYKLRKKQPLRNMFSHEKNAGYLAYIQSAQNTQEAGNIGLTLSREQKDAPWVISDLSLDSLLLDYAKRFGQGDAYYTPLVKNPQGGDSLVLYFGFDEAILTPRSVRQLEIVSQMLKVDPNKKIEISGHTDDVGSEKYNQVLSEARAEAVRQALIQGGLKPEQVVTKGFGKSRPRRLAEPTHTTSTTTPEDSIRRANRRAEIYLDF